MFKKLSTWVIASLTLGMAPHSDPHILGKIQWVAGGAVDMGLMDWVDLLLHGTPWVGLIIVSFLKLKERFFKK